MRKKLSINHIIARVHVELEVVTSQSRDFTVYPGHWVETLDRHLVVELI